MLKRISKIFAAFYWGKKSTLIKWHFLFLLVFFVSSCSEEEITPEERSVMHIHGEIMQKNNGWKYIQALCDDIGQRPSGSKSHGEAIRWATSIFEQMGFDNIVKEEVPIPSWTRGEESLEMILPKKIKLEIVGLSFSANTPLQGIESEVVVVRSKKELDSMGHGVNGKIVLFDVDLAPYHENLGSNFEDLKLFQTNGALWASKYGAKAVLVKSLTTEGAPQAGIVVYGEASENKKIPAANISKESAEQIVRLIDRQKKVRLKLMMSGGMSKNTISHNLYADIKGRENPDEIVMLVGYLDSFDLGQGAQGSASSAVTAIEAAYSLKRLRKIPKRTIRVALFTGRETGLQGVNHFARNLDSNSSRYVAAMELSNGAYNPRGFLVDYEGADARSNLLVNCRDLVLHLSKIDLIGAKLGPSGSQIKLLKSKKIPLLTLDVSRSAFFSYQHTKANTLDKVNPKHLDKCIAIVASMAYLIADSPQRIDFEID